MRQDRDADRFLHWLTIYAQRVSDGRCRLRIPQRRVGLFRRTDGRHLHFMPEFFIQTGGATTFDCPGERFTLLTGEATVIPMGLPHRETACTQRHVFQNFVVHPTPDAVWWHEAGATPDQQPFAIAEHLVHSSVAIRLVDYLNHLVDLSCESGSAREEEMRGVFLGILAFLRSLLTAGTPIPARHSHVVVRAHHVVMNEASDPALSVRRIATSLHCSPDYLSNRFHQETGRTLTAFIRSQRVEQATRLLEESSMSVKEVAAAVGYHSAGYFIRVFKHARGMSPTAYLAFKSRQRRGQQAAGTTRKPAR